MLRRIIGLMLVVGLVLGGCSKPTKEPDPEQAVREQATLVLKALQSGDLEGLAKLVHPSLGVRFSPYAYVHTERDLRFTPDQLRTVPAERPYLWGLYDGSGEPIELTFAAYLKAFAYNQDYLNAPQVAYNQVIRTGNSLNNLPEAYPDSAFMEFHFPGTETYSHIDWFSLRLVFAEVAGKWYLIGVVGDRWTI